MNLLCKWYSKKEILKFIHNFADLFGDESIYLDLLALQHFMIMIMESRTYQHEYPSSADLRVGLMHIHLYKRIMVVLIYKVSKSC